MDRPQEWARTTCRSPVGRLYPSVTPLGSPRAGQPRMVAWSGGSIVLLNGGCGWEFADCGGVGGGGGHVPSWGKGPSLGSLALSSSEIMSSSPPQSLEREHCKDYRYFPSQAECRWASPAGPGPRASKDKSTQAETRGERAMHGLY